MHTGCLDQITQALIVYRTEISLWRVRARPLWSNVHTSGSAVPHAGSCTANLEQLFSSSVFCKSREGTRAGQDLYAVSGMLLTVLWLCHLQYSKRNKIKIKITESGCCHTVCRVKVSEGGTR